MILFNIYKISGKYYFNDSYIESFNESTFEGDFSTLKKSGGSYVTGKNA